MSNLSTNINKIKTKTDLVQLFSGHVDEDIIEIILENQNNNLLLAYEDLIKITNTSDSKQSLQRSFNEKRNENSSAADSNNSNYIDWDYLSTYESPTNKILYLVSKHFKVMVLMRGCSGSGKTYQATNILNMCYKNANVNDFVFSADHFFINKQGVYKFNQFKLNDAHTWVKKKVDYAVQNEITPVIIDNTNICAWEMEYYVKLAVNNGYWIEILEPITEWAWEGTELFKRNQHNIPYDIILLKLQQYEKNITVECLLNRFKLKYNKINQPPKLSNNSKVYKLCENQKSEEVLNILPVKEINNCLMDDNFEDLQIPQENRNNVLCSNFDDDLNCSIDDSIKQKEDKFSIPFIVNELENIFCDIHNIDKENHSVSSTDEASNYVDKSINTCIFDLLFMNVLNEIPENDQESYTIFSKNTNINEGNYNIVNIGCGKLDKGTSTNDQEIMIKPNLNELQKQFPENVCLLIMELFDKCKGNIDWIIDMLEESGHNISKQQLNSSVIFDENNMIKSVQVQNNINQNDNMPCSSSNFKLKTVTSNNKTIEEINCKKKKQSKKTIGSKEKKIKIMNLDDDLKKTIENKFTFDNSLYSKQVLKIKNKKNQNMSDNNDMPFKSEIIEKNLLPETDNNEELVKLVMDTSILTQLSDYFGDSSSNLSKHTFPMSVNLPIKLAEDLYYHMIANVPSNACQQLTLKEDEIIARQLQEKCDEEYSSNISNSHSDRPTFAAVLSKSLLLDKFKNLDAASVMDVYQSHDYRLQETKDILSEMSGNNCLENQHTSHTLENEKKNVNETREHNNLFGSSQNYEQNKLEYAHSKQHYLNKAIQSSTTKMHPEVAHYYYDKAEEFKQKEKYANYKALANLIKQNKDSTTLDLHHLPVQDAIIILDLFLDHHISYIRKFGEKYNRGRQLTVITGRGKHSPNGIARIKPVVSLHIYTRKLIYLEPKDPGITMIIIKKNSLLSSEL